MVVAAYVTLTRARDHLAELMMPPPDAAERRGPLRISVRLGELERECVASAGRSRSVPSLRPRPPAAR